MSRVSPPLPSSTSVDRPFVPEVPTPRKCRPSTHRLAGPRPTRRPYLARGPLTLDHSQAPNGTIVTSRTLALERLFDPGSRSRVRSSHIERSFVDVLEVRLQTKTSGRQSQSLSVFPHRLFQIHRKGSNASSEFRSVYTRLFCSVRTSPQSSGVL